MSRARILVIDDDPDNRSVLRHVLARRDFEVTEAPDGPEGLTLLHDRFFDVVLLDLTMPRLDGLAVCERIRADPDPLVSATPVILLSARRADADRLGGLASGADDYVLKPWSPEALLPRIETAIAQSRLTRPAAYAASPPPAVRLAERPEEGAGDAPSDLGRIAEDSRRGPATALLVLGRAEDAGDLALRYAAAGLPEGERCLYATFRMDAESLRRNLAPLLDRPPQVHEAEGTLRIVDGRRWLRLMRGGRTGRAFQDDEVALWNLVDLVQGGAGQGGWRVRVFDALGPLIETLGADAVRAFIARVAHAGVSSGETTTLFLLDPAAPGFTNGDLAALGGALDGVVEARRTASGLEVSPVRPRAR